MHDPPQLHGSGAAAGDRAPPGPWTGRCLVTGGAGFVGSHTVLALRDSGSEVVAIDDLSTGHRGAVPEDVPLVVADLADRAAVGRVFARWRFDAVLHFASLSLVGESMARPLRYLAENVGNALALADAAVAAGCRRFVLSSTANLFGASAGRSIDEAAPISPGSPYGTSKAMIEQGLDWADRVHGLRYAALRYFNAAGADPAGRLGEDHRPETHLLPLAIDAALGRRPALAIHGADYDTPDGTCIRDYIHVTDLAAAHLAVLGGLDRGSCRYNIGAGRGHSVREVIETVGRVAGCPVPHDVGPRRPGDPAILIADSGRLTWDTGWRPRLSDLETVVRTAHAWRLAHPGGYGGASRGVAVAAVA